MFKDDGMIWVSFLIETTCYDGDQDRSGDARWNFVWVLIARFQALQTIDF
jgi:hypothetical protein